MRRLRGRTPGHRSDMHVPGGSMPREEGTIDESASGVGQAPLRRIEQASVP